jgi:hypothetical protein
VPLFDEFELCDASSLAILSDDIGILCGSADAGGSPARQPASPPAAGYVGQ